MSQVTFGFVQLGLVIAVWAAAMFAFESGWPPSFERWVLRCEWSSVIVVCVSAVIATAIAAALAVVL